MIGCGACASRRPTDTTGSPRGQLRNAERRARSRELPQHATLCANVRRPCRTDIWRVLRPSRLLPYITFVSGKGREPLSVTIYVHLHAHTHSSACRHTRRRRRTRMDTDGRAHLQTPRTSQQSHTRARTRAHMIARIACTCRDVAAAVVVEQRPAGTRHTPHVDPQGPTFGHDTTRTQDKSGHLRPRRHAPSPSPYTLPSPRRRVELPGVFLPLGRLTRR